MGRDWDDFEPKEYQEWCEDWAGEVKRVLKPGGHLLAFSGNRTHHRLFTGVEDAGFEIRDTLTWHYGSGFPKASDLGKSIDKRKGEYENRKFVRKNPDGRKTQAEEASAGKTTKTAVTHPDITKPATEEAKKWDGWKTGLKPATEFVVMARKPFDGATVDAVLEHGTGALNVDATRVGENVDSARPTNGGEWREGEDNFSYKESKTTGSNDEKGRYPSNVVFDGIEAERLDQRVGDVDGCSPHRIADNGERDVLDDGGLDATGGRVEGYEDSGGPSRYFYTSKATKAERTLDGKIDNSHPTVKPQDLMEWLIKLVTREEQIVLDPFAGSGTTCKAAKELNRQFIGIEKQAKWADVARVRCNIEPDDPSVVRNDDNQEGLEAFSDD